MARLRAFLRAVPGPLLLAIVPAAHGSQERLPLEVIDLQAQPVQGLILGDRQADSSGYPTDVEGRTEIPLTEKMRSSGWVRLSPSGSTVSAGDTALVEPWNGYLPLDIRPDPAGAPFRVVVARLPIETEHVDLRVTTSVAARILAQEALHGGLTEGEEGERLALVENRAASLGLQPERLIESLSSLSTRADSRFGAGIGALWGGDLRVATDRLLEVWKQGEASPMSDPALAVDSAQFLGITYLQLGEPGRAAYLLAKAFELRPADLDLLTLLGKALHGTGRFSESEAALRRVLEGRESEAGAEDPSLSPILNNLAILYFEQGRYAEARTLNERALDIEESAGSLDHPLVVALLTNLAAIETAQGHPAAAEPLLQRALEIEENAHGDRGAELANTLNNLALVYFETGRLLEARELYTRVLQIDRTSHGSDSPEVASDISNLALVSDELGATLEAERQYRKALDLREEALDPSHPELAKSYSNLAWFYHRQHRFDEAEALYLTALEVLEAGQGADPLHLAWTLKCLGMLYQKVERFDDAEPLYRRSIEVFESIEGGSHPELISLLWTFAAMLEESGRPDEATELENRARRLRRSG